MAFLKAFWKGYTKHKKLSDEWDLAPKKQEGETETPGSTLEGITFNVKYLGSTTVSTPSSAKATADAVKTIVNRNAKAFGKKPTEVQFAVNLRGINVMELESKTHLMDISLYRISYCSADATHGHVFAFIAINDNDTLECHAFLCPKRKVAQLISITVAQTFNTAFHLWQMTHTGSIPSRPSSEAFFGCGKGSDGDEKRPPPSILQQLIAPVPVLIDLTTPIEEKSHMQWTSFDD
ncbi:low density lipoprotein receptor adapter protein 1-A [Halyomorpha halys]|uniref:low density lipoprotein receptor adapter protein 1-A n=1 Tax=Halyomorpha halys TaxID=286706 RepID=UPI0006D515DC|nr:low density lipoprotein receptor adapter protein 1-A-like [Halyomorpha halys]